MTTKTELLINGNVVAERTTAPFLDFGYIIQSSDVSANATVAVREYIDGALAGTTPVINGVIQAATGGTTDPITPDQLSNGFVWFDGEDETTLTLDVDAVNSWEDKISAKVVSNTIVDRPTYNSTGKFVDLTTGKYIYGGVFTQIAKGQDFEGELIFKSTGNNTQSGWVINTNDTSADRFGIGIRDGNLSVGFYNGTAFETKSVAFTDTTNIHKLRFKRFNGVTSAWLDGVEMTGTASTPISSDTVEFLFGIKDTGKEAQVNIHQFYVKTGEMTQSEIDGINAWSNDKYGV